MTTVSGRCAAGTALSAGKGLVGIVDVHGVIVTGGLAGGGAATGGLALVAGAGASGIDIVAGRVQTLLHLGELLGLGTARDGGAVLERLAHFGFVAEEHALLADQIGLHAGVGIFGIFHALVRLVVAVGFELLFFLLEGSELGLDVRVHEVVDVLA